MISKSRARRVVSALAAQSGGGKVVSISADCDKIVAAPAEQVGEQIEGAGTWLARALSGSGGSWIWRVTVTDVEGVDCDAQALSSAISVSAGSKAGGFGMAGFLVQCVYF